MNAPLAEQGDAEANLLAVPVCGISQSQITLTPMDRYRQRTSGPQRPNDELLGVLADFESLEGGEGDGGDGVGIGGNYAADEGFEGHLVWRKLSWCSQPKVGAGGTAATRPKPPLV